MTNARGKLIDFISKNKSKIEKIALSNTKKNKDGKTVITKDEYYTELYKPTPEEMKDLAELTQRHEGFEALGNPEDWKINLEETNMKKPYVCPVCGGNGLVANGFYTQTSGYWSSTDATPEICRSCNGTGIVWEIEINNINIK